MGGCTTLSSPLSNKTAKSFEEMTTQAGTPTRARRSVGVNSCVTAEDKDTAVSDTVLFMDWVMPYKQRVVPGAQAALEHALTKSCLWAARASNQQLPTTTYCSFCHSWLGKDPTLIYDMKIHFYSQKRQDIRNSFSIFHKCRRGLNLYILHNTFDKKRRFRKLLLEMIAFQHYLHHLYSAEQR